MTLRVNGVVVRVVDRIEIVLDVARGGDTLLNGIKVEVLGGPLRVESGTQPGPLMLHASSQLSLVDRNGNAFPPPWGPNS